MNYITLKLTKTTVITQIALLTINFNFYLLYIETTYLSIYPKYKNTTKSDTNYTKFTFYRIMYSLHPINNFKKAHYHIIFTYIITNQHHTKQNNFTIQIHLKKHQTKKQIFYISNKISSKFYIQYKHTKTKNTLPHKY